MRVSGGRDRPTVTSRVVRDNRVATLAGPRSAAWWLWPRELSTGLPLRGSRLALVPRAPRPARASTPPIR